MKRSSLVLLLLAATMLFAAGASQATLLHFSTILSGANENPPVATPGTGLATVAIDTVAHTMTVHAEFSGLLTNTTNAHIHCCALAPTNAGVATTVPSFVGFPLGVTSGVFDSVLDLTLASSFNPAFVTANGGTVALAEAALIAGMSSVQTYFNIHTTQFPSGEIRGQLIPEPGILGLLALALGAGLLAARRRRS